MARPKKVLKWLVALGLVAGGVTYFVVRRSAADAPVVFKTGKIDRGPVEQIVTATGQLNAVVTVQVGSQVSGQILKLNADFNSKVTEGDIVAEIDPTRFKATLQQNEAQYKTALASSARAKVNNEQAKRDYDRAKELFDKGVMGAADLDAAKSKYDVTRVDISRPTPRWPRPGPRWRRRGSTSSAPSSRPPSRAPCSSERSTSGRRSRRRSRRPPCSPSPRTSRRWRCARPSTRPTWAS